MKRWLPIVAGALAFAVPAVARAQDRVLATLTNVTQLSAWGGHVVYSVRDPATRRYALWDWSGGAARRLNVPERRVRFDADAGSDARGRPVAVYSRCENEPQDETEPFYAVSFGCDVYEVALGVPGARQRLVRSVSTRDGSEFTPTIRGGRIAFARLQPGRRVAEILLQRAPGSRRTIRLSRGPGPPPGTSPRAAPEAMDLGARDLVVRWRSLGDEMRVDSLSGRRLGIVAKGFFTESCDTGGPVEFQDLSNPTADGGAAFFLVGSGNCSLAHTRFVEAAPGARARLQWEPPADAFAYAAALDGRTVYWLRGARPEQTGPPYWDPCQAGCSLVATRAPPFQRVRSAT